MLVEERAAALDSKLREGKSPCKTLAGAGVCTEPYPGEQGAAGCLPSHSITLGLALLLGGGDCGG